jgi:hypothetical protein
MSTSSSIALKGSIQSVFEVIPLTRLPMGAIKAFTRIQLIALSIAVAELTAIRTSMSQRVIGNTAKKELKVPAAVMMQQGYRLPVFLYIL